MFHTVWSTAFSVLYVILFRDALTFMRALWLGVLLWLLVLASFFPSSAGVCSASRSVRN